MEDPLRQITNSLINRNTENNSNRSNLSKQSPKSKKQKPYRFPFQSLLSISARQFDFGECVPNTVHQKIISLTLKQDLSGSVAFIMQIICQDQTLNNLSQFVFAIKKDKQFQFTDNYRFRLNKKGKYDFVIGVKTPNFKFYSVKSHLKIYSEFSSVDNQKEFYIVKLNQTVNLPIIQCSKELQSSLQAQRVFSQKGEQKIIDQPLRVLKFYQIKAKLKKQVKIPFKLQTNSKITLINELIGLDDHKKDFQSNLLQIRTKQLCLTGKGVFILTFKFNFPQYLQHYLQKRQKEVKSQSQLVSYTLRRILILKVHQTNIHFHFPVEVNYFLGSKKQIFTD